MVRHQAHRSLVYIVSLSPLFSLCLKSTHTHGSPLHIATKPLASNAKSPDILRRGIPYRKYNVDIPVIVSFTTYRTPQPDSFPPLRNVQPPRCFPNLPIPLHSRRAVSFQLRRQSETLICASLGRLRQQRRTHDKTSTRRCRCLCDGNP